MNDSVLCRVCSVPVLTCLIAIAVGFRSPDATCFADQVLLKDAFERDEPTAGEEAIGNGWATNSKARAKGNQQVDLVDGAMQITRHPVADHGVSVTHEVSFRDATIELRFQLGPEDDLGINIADMKEKSVHAGHLCMARITTKSVEIHDLKTGRMNQTLRTAAKAKTLSDDQKKLIASKKKRFPHKLTANQWHSLKVEIHGETMAVSIDGKEVGRFASAGMGHATKSRLRLAVNHSAKVDDVLVTAHDPA
ncbi:protein of unknown function [Neorhodopirellula lusitana]|uniref:3-keto-alpha-glucoside-1,2-lyase/3-keto-2-hydroxy-glucal hydratase domain-containing protein n=1 Tax=Neorhodopirellula lusitana TaxID=445327 RepID=A0ABY1Q526_9BACT|nr:family 16 glycoside hydrolase [Neorhodopirellula lusitana]SMP58591.1 protein of unknown function [Neorhodopirellula lusitana]